MFGGKNIKRRLERLSIVGCAGQLSIINAIFQFLLKNFLSNARAHSANSALSHPTFLLRPALTWKRFNIFETQWIFRYFDHKHWKFFTNCICCSNTSNSYLTMLHPLSTYQTLSGRFCLVDIDRRGRIYQRCIYLLSFTRKGVSVRIFHTKMLSSQVAPSYFRQR